MKKNNILVLTAILLLCCVLLIGLSACKGKKKPGNSVVHSISSPETTKPLEVIEPEDEKYPKVGYVVTSEDNLHVRSGAGTNHESYGSLEYGDSVVILDKQGDWFKIEWKEADQQFAYVNAQYVQFSAPEKHTTTTLE